MRRWLGGPLLAMMLATAFGSRAVAAPSAWKIGVRRSGIYRVTGADLAAAGADLKAMSRRRIAMSCGGKEIASLVGGAPDGTLEPGDSVLFYGEGLDTPYTDTNVYWLRVDGGDGKRWGARRAAAPAGADLRGARVTERFEQNDVYGKLTYVEDPRPFSRWFWGSARPGQDGRFPFSLDASAPGAGQPRVVVTLFGDTTLPEKDPDHHTQVLLNGQVLEDARWDGQQPRRIEREVPAAWLKDGPNEVVLRCPGDTAAGALDYVYLDYVEVTRERALAAREGALAFDAAAGPRRLHLAGLAPQARVLDVTDPGAPVLLEGAEPEGGGLVVSDALAAPARYYAASAEVAPAWIAAAPAQPLHSPERGADYIIVAHESLAAAVEPLAARRREQGLRVAVVKVGDVYDAFSHGVFTPEAIRDFLLDARERWARPAPRYVLLVGDGSYDYRDHLKTGAPNLIPPALVQVRGGMETAFDGWYVTPRSGPSVPCMAIGRIPAQTPADVACAVGKILAYEKAPEAPWQKRVVLLADHARDDNEPDIYEQAADVIRRNHIAGRLEVRSLALRKAEAIAKHDATAYREWVRANVTPALIGAINDGALVVEYQGHGDAEFWSRLHALEPGDLAAMRNEGRLPVFLEVSCFTGWFDNPRLPGGRCMAEQMLFLPAAGSVASIAASRLGGMNIDVSLWDQWLREGRATLGDALLATWEQRWSEQRGFWPAIANYNLLGDPALRLRLPASVARAASAPGGQEASPAAGRLARRETGLRLPAPPPAVGIRLETGLVDTSGPYVVGAAPEQAGYYLVQAAAGAAEACEVALKEAGGEVLDRPQPGCAVAYFPAGGARRASASKAVRWIGAFLPAFKVAPTVGIAALRPGATLAVRLRCFRAGEREAIAGRLGSVGGERLPDAGTTPEDSLVVRLPAAGLASVAAWPEVRAVLPAAK